jgi:RimJ/RimL family protein N-acetyltransferase
MLLAAYHCRVDQEDITPKLGSIESEPQAPHITQDLTKRALYMNIGLPVSGEWIDHEVPGCIDFIPVPRFDSTLPASFLSSMYLTLFGQYGHIISDLSPVSQTPYPHSVIEAYKVLFKQNRFQLPGSPKIEIGDRTVPVTVKQWLETSAERLWWINLPATETIIGHVGVNHVDFDKREATIGTAIFDEKHRGKNLGTLAVYTLARYLFDYKFVKVKGFVHRENEVSLRLVQKLGFKLTGQIRESGIGTSLGFEILRKDVLDMIGFDQELERAA